MKDIRIDDEGRQRCWNCGGMNFTHKRTVRSKMVGGAAVVATGGVAAAAAPLATKKKLKCQACGEYNDVGSAKPYTGPASKRAAKKAGTLIVDGAKQSKAPAKSAAPTRPVTAGRGADAAPQFGPAMKQVPVAAPSPAVPVALPAPSPPPPPPPPPSVPAGWHPDPMGRHEHRYWDGSAWTDHVSDGGVQATDPPTPT